MLFKNETTIEQIAVEQAASHQSYFLLCEQGTPQRIIC